MRLSCSRYFFNQSVKLMILIIEILSNIFFFSEFLNVEPFILSKVLDASWYMPDEQRNPLQEYQVKASLVRFAPLRGVYVKDISNVSLLDCIQRMFANALCMSPFRLSLQFSKWYKFLVFNVTNCPFFCYNQVAHIPGALFFDVDGISDKTTNVSSALLRFFVTPHLP